MRPEWFGIGAIVLGVLLVCVTVGQCQERVQILRGYRFDGRSYAWVNDSLCDSTLFQGAGVVVRADQVLSVYKESSLVLEKNRRLVINTKDGQGRLSVEYSSEAERDADFQALRDKMACYK